MYRLVRVTASQPRYYLCVAAADLVLFFVARPMARPRYVKQTRGTHAHTAGRTYYLIRIFVVSIYRT